MSPGQDHSKVVGQFGGHLSLQIWWFLKQNSLVYVVYLETQRQIALTKLILLAYSLNKTL